MTGIFDGMAGVLNDVFGAPVMHTPAATGLPVEVQGIFRRDPIGVADEDGREFLVTSPSLRVERPYAADIQAGDTIEVGDGARFTVLNAQRATASPASDALVVFELEAIDA
ncbi:head-tail joining protein [Roseovarius sp.]|uniref:head-tail joining protein n=1 Tax=Roseovarius sp. TaxID=1486281 RepID=UPI003D0E2A7D